MVDRPILGAASSKDVKGETIPTNAAGEPISTRSKSPDKSMEATTAPPVSTASGGIKVVNRSGVTVRITAEVKSPDQDSETGWDRDGILNLADADQTEVQMNEGRRIIIDAV